MTITMIVAIIAAVIFSVLCFLCVYFLISTEKEAKKNEERMKALEYKMGLMGELINQKTDMIAEKMTVQETAQESAGTPEPVKEEPKKEEAEEEEESISLEEIFGRGTSEEEILNLLGDDFEDVLVEDEPVAEPVAEPAPVKPAEPTPAKPVEPITPPQGIEERYETGKSGKKYSFSELEKLIRE